LLPGVKMDRANPWVYPSLAKPESDGAFCYYVQRRISVWFSVRLAEHMDANAATGLDLMLGVGAALLVLLDHWLWGVVLIQIFGIFSCVDGEIARILDQPSRIGDFLDTLTDRCVELLVVAATTFSLASRVDAGEAFTVGFALLGSIFLLTNSSEKFRSAWQKGYPKRRLESLFSPVSAGSDSRLLLLSIGLVVSELTGNGQFLLWLLAAVAMVGYGNFLVRIALVYRHFRNEDVTD
jgi:phosphatidylglycerophosphate synthase